MAIRGVVGFERRRMMVKKKKNKKKRKSVGRQIGGGGSQRQRLGNDTGLAELEKLEFRQTHSQVVTLSPHERDLAQSGEIGEGSKCYRCKCKRDYKKKKKSTILEDPGSTDEEESPYQRVHAGIHSSQYKMNMIKSEMDFKKRLDENMYIIQCEYAAKALKLYKDREGVEFEVVEPLFSECANLCIRGAGLENISVWCHASFTAKPKNNADCNGVSSLKYFFAEFVQDKETMQLIAMYCSTFDPCKDEGNKAHGCAVCPLEVKFHPGPKGYVVGHPPYYKLPILQ